MAGQEPACESTHTRLGGQASGYKFLMARCRGLKLPRQGSFALGVAPQSSRKRSNDGHQSFGIFTEHVVEILFAKQSHLPVLQGPHRGQPGMIVDDPHFSKNIVFVENVQNFDFPTQLFS